jgi:hypothetical protein
MSKYHDFKNREICFFDSEKKGYPIRGFKADYEIQIDEIPRHERDLRNKKYNSYCSICQYDPMPWFNPWDNVGKNKAFKQWVEVRDLTISRVDFFIDFDGTDLKTTFNEALDARKYLIELIGSQAQYLNIYFSGNKGFHLLGKMGESFGKTPKDKLKKNYELAMMLKPLCPTIDETIYDLARVRKLIGSKVYSPVFGLTRVVSCDSVADFNALMVALDSSSFGVFESMVVKRLNKVEITNNIGL